MTRGRITTGLLKIVGGAAVAFILASQDDFVSGKRLLSDAILIALAANLGNLLDRAPGRVIKVGVLAWIPIAIVAGTGPVGIAIAPVMGAFLGLLGDDLRERLMLGDTGANALGALLGVTAVVLLPFAWQAAVALVLAGLNLYAESHSLSAFIQAHPLLDRLDRWGWRKAES